MSSEPQKTARRTLSLRSRMLAGFAMMALMVSGLAGFMLWQESRFRDEIQLLAEQQNEVQNRLQDLREHLSSMQRNAFQGGLLRDKKLLLYAAGEATKLYEVFDIMRANQLKQGPAAQQELLEFLDDTEQIYREVTPRNFAVLAQLSEGITPDPEDLSQLRLDNIRLNSAFDAYLHGVRGNNAEQLQASMDRLQRFRWTSLGIVLLAVLAMGGYLFQVNYHLALPLQDLSGFIAGLRDPAAAVQRARVIRADEIGRIASATNDMLDKLRDTTVSRDQFDRVLASLANALLVVSPDGRIASANHAAQVLFGNDTSDALTGRHLAEVLPPFIAHAFAHGTALHNQELELPRPGQRPVPLIMAMAPIAPGAEWIIEATDLTALRQAEDKYRQVIDNVSEGILVLREGRIVFANPQAAKLIGREGDALSGREFLQSVHPEDLPLMQYRHARRQRGEVVDPKVDFRVVQPDGTVVWLGMNAVALHWEGQDALLAFVTDISARKKLEQDLQHTLTEREAVLNSALVGISVTGLDRRHRWVNQRFADMLGFAPAELIGNSSSLHYPDEAQWRSLGLQAYPRLIAGETYSVELRMKRKDGSLLWVEMFGACLDLTQPDKGMIWTMLDISERYKAQQDIQAALDKQRELNVLKSSFVAMTSHEFRTPLASILSSEELLRHYGERLDAAERDELFTSIETAVRRMAEMLDKILIIGRGDADLMEFKPAPLDLAALCRALRDDAITAPGGSGQPPTLRLAVELADPRVLADEKLLRHILGNLMSNAIKYSPNGGSVDVTVREEEDDDGAWLRFEVADQGIGIPEAELPRLFDTFHRAANVGNIPGTGLGLAIVKRAVQCHGGDIAVQSQAGQGTRFTVRIPSVREAARSTTQPLEA